MGEYGPRRVGYSGACVDGPLFGRNLVAEKPIMNVPVYHALGLPLHGRGVVLETVYRFDSALRVWHSQPLQPDREVPRGVKV